MALRSADSPREAQVHRTYTFGAAAAPAAGGWDPRPFARVAVEDAYVVRGARGGGGAGVGRLEGGVVPAAAAGALLGVRVNHTAVLSAAACSLVSDALLPGAFNGEARSALATHPTRGTNGNPSALLTLADGRAVALMAFDSVLRAHAVLSGRLHHCLHQQFASAGTLGRDRADAADAVLVLEHVGTYQESDDRRTRPIHQRQTETH